MDRGLFLWPVVANSLFELTNIMKPGAGIENAVPQRISHLITKGRTRDFLRISSAFHLRFVVQRIIFSPMEMSPLAFPRTRPVELCQLAGRWAGILPEGGAMAELKVDGWRCLYFPGIDRARGLWTRGGMPVNGASHILSRLVEIEEALGGAHMIDGEFQVGGTLADTKSHQERGWKLGDAGTFFAFDAVPLADWQRGRCDTPLHERKASLMRAIDATAPSADAWEWAAGSYGAGHGADPVQIVADTWVFDASDVEAEARLVWNEGLEGLMLKDAAAPYVRARSNAWLKVKRAGADQLITSV